MGTVAGYVLKIRANYGKTTVADLKRISEYSAHLSTPISMVRISVKSAICGLFMQKNDCDKLDIKTAV